MPGFTSCLKPCCHGLVVDPSILCAREQVCAQLQNKLQKAVVRGSNYGSTKLQGNLRLQTAMQTTLKTKTVLGQAGTISRLRRSKIRKTKKRSQPEGRVSRRRTAAIERKSLLNSNRTNKRWDTGLAITVDVLCQ